jgi:transglutaminase-like putative cysteine protease
MRQRQPLRFPLLFPFFFLLALLILPAHRSPAQGDPNLVALRGAGSAKDYPGAATLVVYDSSDVDVEESGLSHVVMHRLVKALTPQGAKELRAIDFGYDPLSAYVDVRYARIYRADGSVETLAPERVTDYPAPARAIYWGAREKSVDVGHLDAGDAVETVVYRKGFTYALLAPGDDDKYIPPMRGHFYDIVEFWSSAPVLEKTYRIAVPADKPLQYEVYNGELGASVHFPSSAAHRITVEMNPAAAQHPTPADELHPTARVYRREGKTVYTWWKRNIAPFRGEPGGMAASDVAPKLLLSTARDWYAKSVWFNGVNEAFKSFEVTPEVKALVDELLAGVTDELERIAILNHWAAEEIRYSGISMGTGEGYTLHPGSMTFADRCGVCKDKAGMVITMLRAAGFESYPAMTMAGSRVDAIPADQFNHSVALVKRANGNWMLLDPTWIPGVREMWSSAEQQQQFLPGIPGGADIMTTPVSPAENHYLRLANSSKLGADGTLEGSLTVAAEGQTDAGVRRAFERSFRSSWTEVIPRLLASSLPAVEILGTEMGQPGDLSQPMRIAVRYRIPRYATVAGSTLAIVPLLARNPFSDGLFASELAMDTTLAERRFGFRLRCSKLVEIHDTLALPSAMKAVALPRFEGARDGASSFEASYRVTGSTLLLDATHRMEKRVYEASDWPVFRAGLAQRLRLMRQPVVLEK